MKKFIKYSIRALGTLFLVIFLSAFICVTALFVYATRGIDASLDFEELMAARGLTSVIYSQGDDGTITEMIRLHGTENRIWTDIENVPSHVIDAFVSIEDHRFFDHNGIDTRRTAGAIMSFLNKSSSDYGGSTITQQLIKNLTGDDEITVKRKLTEIMRALKLEKSVSKTDILEAYLNTVYLSNGCYGIETASEYFFSKPVSELSLSEGAALAAILKYPYKYDPVKHPENNDGRRKTVLFRMYELGKISKDEYESAINDEITLNVSKRITAARHLSWFEETVIDEVRRDLCEKYGYSKSAAADMIYGGGLSIVTTVDPEMQAALEKIYENERNFPTSGVLETPESAAVIIDSKSGALLAVVGARGEKTSDRILNYATRLTRSPGSVIKPISVYAPALDKGIITWATVFDDVPVSFSKNDDGSYTMWPKNNPRIYSGLTNVNHALETSINTVSVRILQKLKARYSYSFLKNVGITTLVESRKMPNGKIATDISEAPLALGAVTDGCTLYQLCGAYSFLADGGVYRKPYSYTAVYDRNGNQILENSGDGERVISEESAFIMTKMLENVVQTGTAKGMGISKSVSVAGKTGTSNADTDRFFIGYTPDYICGIWFGYVDARSLGYYKTNPACAVFDKVMSKAYSLYPEKAANTFVCPENVVKCLYCRDSGLLPDSACICDARGNRIELGYFKKGTEPQDHCDTHILVDYDISDGGVVFDGENVKKVALVKNYSRSFPCDVKISDAQYTYRFLSPLCEPSKNENEAYFQSLQKENEFFGTSNVSRAFNRFYKKKDENIPEIPPDIAPPPEESREYEDE